MALYKAGSGEVVKSLWVNSDTTSSFAYQAVTLSESVRNFDLIGVKFNDTTSGSISGIVYVETAEFVTYTGNNAKRMYFGGYFTSGSTTANYIRSCEYISNTTIRFNSCLNQTYQSSSALHNDMVIPTEIVGVKF